MEWLIIQMVASMPKKNVLLRPELVSGHVDDEIHGDISGNIKT